MIKTRRIFVVFFSTLILLFTLFITNVFATVEYYNNGKPSKITTDKGTITYYLNGVVESITTPEGTAKYELSGTISSITGNPSISLDEARAEINKLNTSSSATSSSTLPTTGIENSYLFLIPIIGIIIVFLIFKSKEFKNI